MSMNEIRAMREKRVKLWEAAKAFVESRKDANGTLSAEDSATYDQMEADVIRMGKEIERLERQEALDLEFDRPTARTLTDKPAAPEGKAEKTGRASDAYKTAFWRTMRDKSVPHEVLNALQTGTVDGQDNPLPTVKSAKFYEVQKSISLTNHLVDSVWPTINLNTWNKLTDTQKGWVMEAVEAARVACDEQNIKTESEVQDFLREQGLTIYEADVAAFADHVLETYLADPISDTWDKDLLAQIQAMA